MLKNGSYVIKLPVSGYFFSIYSIWEAKENSASHKKIEGLAYLEAKRIEFFEWKLKNP
jgi:hypothetical protein